MTGTGIADFLLARFAEDEEIARRAVCREVDNLRHDGLPDTTREDLLNMPESDAWRRPFLEVEAKRGIVERYQVLFPDGATDLAFDTIASAYVLRYLALPYAEHPDYRPEWRP